MLPTHRKPTPPGKILQEEFLTPLGFSQSAFVEHLGGTWTQPKLSEIINGKRAITEEIALDLADALGTSPDFWLGLQSDVNLWKATQSRRKIKRIRMQSQSLIERRKVRAKAGFNRATRGKAKGFRKSSLNRRSIV